MQLCSVVVYIDSFPFCYRLLFLCYLQYKRIKEKCFLSGSTLYSHESPFITYWWIESAPNVITELVQESLVRWQALTVFSVDSRAFPPSPPRKGIEYSMPVHDSSSSKERLCYVKAQAHISPPADAHRSTRQEISARTEPWVGKCPSTRIHV